MGCCGSKDSKNAVHPGDKRRHDNVQIVVTQEELDRKKRKPLRPEDVPWRRKKEEKPPEPPKEIEIVGRVELTGHSQNVDICGWHPHKPILLTAGTDRKVLLWDLRVSFDKPKCKELELSISDAASCFHWSEGGKKKHSQLAIGTDRGYVYLWSEDGEKLDSWQVHSNPVHAVKQNGRFVLSVGDTVCVYNTKGRSVFTSAWNNSDLTDAEWISEKQFLVADDLGTITLDTMEESQFMPINFDYEPPMVVPEHQYKSHFGGVYKVRCHPKRSKVFVSCSVDNTVKIWQVDSGTPQRTLDEHFGYVMDVQWVADGDLLASASYDGTVKLWDSRTGDIVHNLEKHRDKVSGLALTEDGGYLASAGHDGDVHLWSADSGDFVNTHEGPGRILAVAFSRHSNEFVAVASYGAVEILRLEYNEPRPKQEEERFEPEYEEDRRRKPRRRNSREEESPRPPRRRDREDDDFGDRDDRDDRREDRRHHGDRDDDRRDDDRRRERRRDDEDGRRSHRDDRRRDRDEDGRRSRRR